MEKKPTFMICLRRGGGGRRFYWQPSKKWRDAGARAQPLGNDELDAIKAADALNELWTPYRVAERREKIEATKSWKTLQIAPGGPHPRGVYVVSDQRGSIKVGVTVNPHQRLHTLQNGHPSPLLLIMFLRLPGVDAILVELAVHRALGDVRGTGEWFGCNPARGVREVMAAVDAYLQMHSPPPCSPRRATGS